MLRLVGAALKLIILAAPPFATNITDSPGLSEIGVG